jgi:C4-dicarboxylate transporter/malic acid transport protein
MTTTTADPYTTGGPRRPRAPAHSGLLPALEHPSDVLQHVTPNWFAAVMGTGIVANAAATLQLRTPALLAIAFAVWALASTLLVVLSLAFAAHWVRHRETARAYAQDPVMSQFYGAPAMALLTVGAGTQLVGYELLGRGLALAVFGTLWVLGTALGLATSMWVPFRMITAHDRRTVVALPAWLMPIVPPMVSASTGALLLAHVPSGQARFTLLLGLYGLFGISLVLGMLTLSLVYGRLVNAGPLPVQAAPTIWITLGMVGQSITAANLLGSQAGLVVDQQTALGLHVLGIAYGAVMTGFALLLVSLATALTVHAARRGLRFSLSWWSFTFPLGTLVTGLSALGTATGARPVEDLAATLFGVLVLVWLTVTTRTARAVRSGSIFLPA